MHLHIKIYNRERIKQDDISNKFGVTCLCEEYDNILMWSHYARFHEGVCVGFDTSLFPDGVKNKLIKVKYSNKRPILNYDENNKNKFVKENVENAKKIIRTKSCGWKYEKEWRLVYYEQSGKVDIGNSIKQVIFGERFPKIMQDRVMKKLAGRNITFREASLSKISFKLDFKDL